MAAGPFTPYNQGLLGLLDRSIDFAGGTIQARLLRATYTPSVSAHDTWDDVSSHEVADADYAAQAVAGKTITYSTGGSRVEYACGDVDFGSAVTITAKYAVLLAWTGTPTTSRLIGYADLNTASTSAVVGSTADDFKLRDLAPFFYVQRPA